MLLILHGLWILPHSGHIHPPSLSTSHFRCDAQRKCTTHNVIFSSSLHKSTKSKLVCTESRGNFGGDGNAPYLDGDKKGCCKDKWDSGSQALKRVLHALCSVASVASNSLQPHGRQPIRPLCLWGSLQEYWSGSPCSPPGDLPDTGTEPPSPASPALQADSLPLSHWGSPTPLRITSDQWLHGTISAVLPTHFRAVHSEKDINRLEERRSKENKEALTHWTSTSILSLSVCPVQLCPALGKITLVFILRMKTSGRY